LRGAQWFTLAQRRLRDFTYVAIPVPLKSRDDIRNMENASETISRESQPMSLTGRRSHSRLRLNLAANVELIDGPAKCSLENVSAHGARIAMVEAPPVHALGLLHCDEFEACFTVIWRMGNRVGVLFDRMVSHDAVFRLRRTVDKSRQLEFEQLRREAMDWIGMMPKAF
jgi:hypothetical protein